jgi:hypothetical protein
MVMILQVQHYPSITTDKSRQLVFRGDTNTIIITHYRDNTCGIEGGYTPTSFRNIMNMKTAIAVAKKPRQFPRISTHLKKAE